MATLVFLSFSFSYVLKSSSSTSSPHYPPSLHLCASEDGDSVFPFLALQWPPLAHDSQAQTKWGQKFKKKNHKLANSSNLRKRVEEKLEDKVRDSKIRCATETFLLRKHKLSSSKGKGKEKKTIDFFRSSLPGGQIWIESLGLLIENAITIFKYNNSECTVDFPMILFWVFLWFLLFRSSLPFIQCFSQKKIKIKGSIWPLCYLVLLKRWFFVLVCCYGIANEGQHVLPSSLVSTPATSLHSYTEFVQVKKCVLFPGCKPEGS